MDNSLLDPYNDEKQNFAKWKKITIENYDILKAEEQHSHISYSKNNQPLKKLYADNVDAEQIFQQIELQTKCTLSEDADESDYNLYQQVVKLDVLDAEQLANSDEEINLEHNQEHIFDDEEHIFDDEEQISDDEEQISDDEEQISGDEEQISGNDEEQISGDDEELISGDDEELISGDEEEQFSGDREEQISGDEEEQISGDDEEEDLCEDEKDLFEDEGIIGDEEDLSGEENDLDDSNSIGSLANLSDSDFDKDTFGDLALEGDESESDEEAKSILESDEEYESRHSENLDANQKRKFNPSMVDDKFFSIRESEWIADNDIIGKSVGEDIDYMEDLDSDDEVNDALYAEFFDPPNNVESSNKKKIKITEEGDTEVEQKIEEEEKKVEEKQAAVVGKNQSRFEIELMQEGRLKKSVEDENYILEKPWELKGETTKNQRPVNSALEEALEFNVGVREKPVITEDITALLERLILSRIKTQSWDDVVRRVRPSINPTEYKQKIVLNEEKSTKSLAQIYEEEYIQKQKQSETTGGPSMLLSTKESGEESLPIHKEIKQDLLDLISSLDALTNYHYLPKQRTADLKVVSNLSAITLEESTPMTATDATLLAPQEILSSKRGDLKSAREETSTDKKRKLRKKKQFQKSKAKRQEAILKTKSEKKDKHGLMHKDASISLVQRALKTGQVKAMEGNDVKTKSSKQFFSQYNEMKNNVIKGSMKRQQTDSSVVGNKSKKRKKGATKDCSTLAKVLLT